MKQKKEMLPIVSAVVAGVLTLALIAIVATAMFVGVKRAKALKSDIMLIKSEMGTVKSDVKVLKGQVSVLKDSAKKVASCVKEKDTDGAKAAKIELDSGIETVRLIMSKPVWEKLRKFPVASNIVGDVDELLDLVTRASDEIIGPAIVQLEAHPLDSLKEGDGFNVKVINSYIDFVEELEPTINEISDGIASIDLGILDIKGSVSKYTKEMSAMLDSYTDAKEYFPVMKAFFGNGEDKLYLLAAQNTSELRASGGFPGSMGTIKIQRGILTIGDFVSVYDVLPAYTTEKAKVTKQEDELFNTRLRLYWDSDFCPDFERVAFIWAVGYEQRNYKKLDGVVSMTPAIVQELLKCTGQTIKLDDGTVLDGTNATMALQKDLYFKYFGRNTSSVGSNEMADAMFAQAAKETMHMLVSDFDVSKLNGYAKVFKEGVADRTIMMWMSDEKEQKLVVDKGLSAKLNMDKNKPEVGVYFGSSDASKMGIFMDIDVDISDPTINSDNTRTYNVRVVYNNIITQKEIAASSEYILGSYGGGTLGMVHIVAPAGGKIKDFATNSSKKMIETEYLDHQLGYMLNVVVYPEKPLEVTFKVTTAPGVTTPLGFNKTPTLQSYR